MPPVVIGGAIAAAGAVGGAALGASASKKASKSAANAQLEAAAQNNALTREIYDKNYKNLSPWMTRGNTAGGAVNALLGLGGDPTAQRNAFDTFRDSTGYQFRMGEGMNALNSGYAARGMLNSGAAQKAAMRYGQDYASGEFGNYLSALNSQNQTGFAAGSALAGVGQNMANNISANNQSAADARSNAAIASGVANSNMYAGIGNALGNLSSNVASSFGGGSGAGPTWSHPPGPTTPPIYSGQGLFNPRFA